jgi:FtsP/CotA-like multicopper oxidase with cupredoxin domain
MGEHVRSAISVIGGSVLALLGLSSYGENQPSPSALPEIQLNDNRHPGGELRLGVLHLGLDTRMGTWHPEGLDAPSVEIAAFTVQNGPLQNPGPLIRVPQGTEVEVTIRNSIVGKTLHVHGLHERPGMPEEALEVSTGTARQVRFHANTAGTYFYWGALTEHGLEERGAIDGQLHGAFVVDAPGSIPTDHIFVLGHYHADGDLKANPPRADRDTFVINGGSWPHTELLTYKTGESIRWRWINATDETHPMHMHGHHFRVDAMGDNELDHQRVEDERAWVVTQHIDPGHTMFMTWKAERPGNWLFHCHIQFHIMPEVSLSAPPLLPPVDLYQTATHSHHHMAGLALGIHVLPAEASASAKPAATTSRKLTVVVGETGKRYGASADFGGPYPQLGYQVLEGENPKISDAGFTSPGAPIILTRGEPVEITIVNRLKQPTAVHWHGIELESYYDGVVNWSGDGQNLMPPIAPGSSFVVRMTPPRAGTFIYHTHLRDYIQMSTGLYGPLLVLEPGEKFDSETDKIFTFGRDGADDVTDPIALNGSAQPSPLSLKAGKTYRLRFVQILPAPSVQISLAGETGIASWKPLSKDASPVPRSESKLQPAKIEMWPGETYDFEFHPEAKGELQLESTIFGKLRMVMLVKVE